MADESVRAELVRLQKQTGLTLAFYENGLPVVSFEKRHTYAGKFLVRNEFGSGGEVSPDGTQIAIGLEYFERNWQQQHYYLGIVRSDGSIVREYPRVAPIEMCWSHDQSKMAMTAYDKVPTVSLVILDLGSKLTEVVVPRLDNGHLTSQCWSPDDKQIVYESEGNVRVLEIGKDRSSVLAKGTEPTWSPDGNWIAFRDHDTYYAVRPGEEARKMLFHKTRAVSGLYWSPDSRLVAYAHQNYFALDLEFYSLMVRRLKDNSEDRVADAAGAGAGCQWVTNRELLKLVESQASQK